MTLADLEQRIGRLERTGAPDGAGRLLGLLLDDTEADVALAIQLGRTSDGPRLTWYAIDARDRKAGDDVEAWVRATTAKDWPDFTRPRPSDLNRFVVLDPARTSDGPSLFENDAFAQHVTRILRVLVYRDGELIAWVGALRVRELDFSRRIVRRWRQVADRFANAFADSVHDVGAVGEGYAVIRSNGDVQFATDNIAPALPQCVAAVKANEACCGLATRTYAGGLEIVLRPGAGPFEAATLVSARGVERLRCSADSLLTPTQREVANYAALGATSREIASTLNTAVDTVKTHLREIYRRLEVGSRVELAERLRPTTRVRVR